MTVSALDHSTRQAKAPSSAIIIGVAFVILALDFFDTTSIGFVVPTLAKAWSLPPAAFTPAFVATSLGAVIGYMACGPLSKIFGRRLIAAISILIFSLASLATMYVDTITALAIVRLVTAIGLGGLLPVAIDVSADVMPPKYRSTAAMIVITGGGFGSIAGGIAGGPLISNFGWPSVFLVGGVLPLILLPAVVYYFRNSFPPLNPAAPSPAKAAESDGNLVRALFANGLALDTIVLWAFAFIIFVDAYALIFWIPTLLTDLGFPATAAPAGTAAYGMGGLVGCIFVMAMAAGMGAYRGLLIALFIGIVCIGVMSQTAIAAQVWILLLIGGMGAGLITCCVGQSALAVRLYPSWLRTTGVGWAAALGRIGSILGPAVGGAVLALGWAPRNIILLAIVPAIVGIALLLVLQRIDASKGLALNAAPQPSKVG